MLTELFLSPNSSVANLLVVILIPLTHQNSNSNALQILDSKLSTLEESQCQDLKKLLQGDEDLFPDVFSRTDHL